MENDNLLIEIHEAAKKMRKDAVQMTYNMGNVGAHIGGGLSLIEIMAVLYLGILKYDIHDMQKEDRDRLIFSKGHGTLALYTAMVQAGILKKEELVLFKQDESTLSAHPVMNASLGIEFSSGSLGQGLSLAVGCGLALRRKNNATSRIYVILGDGECDEGSVWEAAASASHYKLSNITVIVDVNHFQYDGKTDDILNMISLKEKWKSFGWDVEMADGHDVEQIYHALKKQTDRPYVLLADTVKGKGISFMEGNPVWHNGRLSKEQYEQAMQEVGR